MRNDWVKRAYNSQRSMQEEINLNQLNASHKLVMKNSFNDVNITSRKLKMVVKKVDETPVTAIRGKSIQMKSSPQYNMDSYEGQALIIGYDKNKIIIGSNRPGTTPQEIKFAKVSPGNLVYMIKTYRNDNNLKCCHFTYFNANIEGDKGHTNCNTFAKEWCKWVKKNS